MLAPSLLESLDHIESSKSTLNNLPRRQLPMPEQPKGLTVVRHLPVKIDTFRKNALADEMALNRREEIRITEHMKRVTDSLKALIKEAQHKQTVAAEAISNGFEMKEVVCRQEIDFATNTIRVFLDDTGEQIEERALEPKERERYSKPSSTAKKGGPDGIHPL
jgi:ribonuclease D